MKHAAITGIGAYLPERRLTNADLETMVDTSDEWIRTRTGIGERRLAAEGEATSDLAAAAGVAAIADAGLTVDDIDFLVVGTSSPDHVFPSTASLVQAKLGLTCAGVDVMAACTSFVFALHHATVTIEAGRASTVLVIGADALTRHVDFTDRRTCVLFGDGAGAVVLQAADEPGIMGIDLGSDGTGADVLTIPAGGSAMPCTPERVAEGLHHVRMVGSEVFKFAVRAIPETTERALAASGLTSDDVTWLVPHQANQRILDTVADRLGIAHERVVSHIEWVGNTSSASIPLAVHDLYTSGNLRPGDVLALVGFGAGLTWGAAIVRWTKGPVR
ncbi:MAG: ketoacyl-ACP synthase III [Coriobacteriia bacterium]|nr:ketoacyl-ACP synthase III [Coriobacteriia bacterium]MBN2847133.1 ketoacyl-ACP synthase III [Coriobacteriia bacterium]